MIPVNVPNFTIPFEIGGPANAIREVELLVSKDRGKSWQFVARQPVETGKFAFRANTDGEYWFSFRTITATEMVNPMTAQPELRVQVNTGNPAVASSQQQPQPSESGPIVPPRPERFRPESHTPTQQPMQPAKTEEPKTDEPATEVEPQTKAVANVERGSVEKPQILAPRFPGFDPSAPENNRNGDFVDDLLSEMSQFLDVQPVAVRSTPDNQVATDRSKAALPKFPADVPAGSISGIVLNQEARPQIVVRWHTGQEQLWSGAQVDVFRYGMHEGQWSPIAINLPNNGEYWWYLSPEDLNPFYIAVRIRSPHGGNSVDVTQEKIEIDSRFAVFQSQRP